tara:strand:+ start:6152 stop:6388 length:237 start_codon:yes stop_codon:yes gene_type:complete
VALHDDDYRACIAYLRDERTRRHVTQQQLARLLNKPQSFVSKFERGDRRLDIAEFIRVANALEIPISEALKSLGWRAD